MKKIANHPKITYEYNEIPLGYFRAQKLLKIYVEEKGGMDSLGLF